MKKILISLTMVFGIIVMVNGQELVSKKGFTILPESGDYVIGFNAVPVVDFFLNAADIMTNAGTTSQHPGYVPGFNQVLVGKYFLEDTKAIRGKLAINTTSTTTHNYYDDPMVATDPSELEDVLKSSSSLIILGGGMEFRRGHNRVQGFYGGELLLGFASNSMHNTWGVEMTDASITSGDAISGRVLEQKSGMGITFGLRGFAGIEYFFAPKISIAAEFGWGFGMSTTPRGSQTVENWNATDLVAEEETNEGLSNTSGMGFQVDNGIGQTLMPSAALMMYFHF